MTPTKSDTPPHITYASEYIFLRYDLIKMHAMLNATFNKSIALYYGHDVCVCVVREYFGAISSNSSTFFCFLFSYLYKYKNSHVFIYLYGVVNLFKLCAITNGNNYIYLFYIWCQCQARGKRPL